LPGFEANLDLKLNNPNTKIHRIMQNVASVDHSKEDSQLPVEEQSRAVIGDVHTAKEISSIR